jgi:aminodeoxyfutalosine synthase
LLFAGYCHLSGVFVAEIIFFSGTSSSNTMESFIEQAGLGDILVKVNAAERLSQNDGRRLYECPDLLAVGWLANRVRERKNGNQAFFIYNQHINYSNICSNLCKFCAFGKEKGHELAYEMSIEQIKDKVRERLDEPITEIHMVGGIHPDLPYSYYLEALRGIKTVRPDVHIQAFTCVEIQHLADLAGKSVDDTLEELKEAGLGSLPGGGAEVFSPRIRELTCPKKLDGAGWLRVAKTAHRCGLKSNATMLYGHIETIDERLEHLDALRQAQDETGGFMTFIPLAFHPKNTELADLSRTTGVNDLKNIAVARLMLDNFPHIKAYWVMIGPKLAQVALSFGADDMDGTVKEEIITRMAGGESEQALGHKTLIRLIKEAGREPVERDTLYNVLARY